MYFRLVPFNCIFSPWYHRHGCWAFSIMLLTDSLTPSLTHLLVTYLDIYLLTYFPPRPPFCPPVLRISSSVLDPWLKMSTKQQSWGTFSTKASKKNQSAGLTFYRTKYARLSWISSDVKGNVGTKRVPDTLLPTCSCLFSLLMLDSSQSADAFLTELQSLKQVS